MEEFSGTDINSVTRSEFYCNLRTIYYYLCMMYSEDGISYSSVAKSLNKNHATVINALKNFDHRIKYEIDFKKLYERSYKAFRAHFKDDEKEILSSEVFVAKIDSVTVGIRLKRLLKENKLLRNYKNRYKKLKGNLS